jgi:hypothetical protein
MVEVRLTTENQSFAGYCVEFYSGDVLLAVCAMGSHAYAALVDLYEGRGEVTFTATTQNRRGECVVEPLRGMTA